MRTRSKSTLFLIEQLIVIAVFAICAAACISILANAFSLARDSRDISNALFAAESVAESVKATSGDLILASEIGGWSTYLYSYQGANLVYFDNSWQISTRNDAEFVLSIRAPDSRNPHLLFLEFSELASYIRDSSYLNSRLLSLELSVSRASSDMSSVSRISDDELVSFPLAVRLPPTLQ